MDYKEKYEQALGRARTFSQRWQGIEATDSELALQELKEIFPELKESEDERIKAEIIAFVEQSIIPQEQEKRWLAWLEKQRKQETTTWSEEDEKERKRVVGLLEGWLYTFKETCYAEDCKCGISWLKSLKQRMKGE